MLGEDPAVNAARLRAVRATTVALGQQEAQERRTKVQRKENAWKRKRERQQTERDAWVRVATEPDQWVSALLATPRTSEIADHRRLMDQAASLEAAGPMGDDPMVPQKVQEQAACQGWRTRDGPRHVRIWPRQTKKTSDWQVAHTHTRTYG